MVGEGSGDGCSSVRRLLVPSARRPATPHTIPVSSRDSARRSRMIGIKRSVSWSDGLPGPGPAAVGSVTSGSTLEGARSARDLEKRRVVLRARCGIVERRWGSSRREMGSSEVSVNERKRVERLGIEEKSSRDLDGSKLVAKRICERSWRSLASRLGSASFRPAQETRRIDRSTLGTMPMRCRVLNVSFWRAFILEAGGELGSTG